MKPTWTNTFTLIISTLRLGGQIIPTQTNTIRTFTDHEIPPWLPTLPQSIKSKK